MKLWLSFNFILIFIQFISNYILFEGFYESIRSTIKRKSIFICSREDSARHKNLQAIERRDLFMNLLYYFHIILFCRQNVLKQSVAVVETTTVSFPNPHYQNFIPQQYSFDGYPQVTLLNYKLF